MKKSIGKNTLGGGNKMQVDLRTYNRSTHNLSFAWRSTMNVGTLVPFMCEVGLPGDTWDITLAEKVLTHPTVGPLFGSYKLQLDVFTCPMRLYIAQLHNNALGIGLDMSKVKIPQFRVFVANESLPTSNNKWGQINPSALLAYLGRRGFSGKASTFPSTNLKEFNAMPAIAYYDIFKNYYANKQEEKWYTITNQNIIQYTNFLTITRDGTMIKAGDGGGNLILQGVSTTDGDNVILQFGEKEYTLTKLTTGASTNTFKAGAEGPNLVLTPQITINLGGQLKSVRYKSGKTSLAEWKLSDIDDIREKILSTGKNQYTIVQSDKNYLSQHIDVVAGSLAASGNVYNSSKPQFGLALKTLQSDIFNNWVNSEWVDGENGIAAITAIDTSSGSFNLDTLNLSQKVYNMLNRIAVSGGTYQDWVETVYTSKWNMHTETPVYEGGMSAEIIFNEVVSTNTGSDEALGTIAGRGTATGKSGGKLHIKVSEPCYIIGIASITPRVDYCQGNRWDSDLKTMDDLHKPALDGIGYQDLMAKRMAWWEDKNQDPEKAIGKQPAWIEYMTNYSRTFGNFAIEDNEAFMCLNRYYYPKDDNYQTGELNYTTYINPSDYQYTFADNSLDAQNFWVQVGVGIKARRVMSAKQIPNL